METILIEYNSNNSGGDWWLDEAQWRRFLGLSLSSQSPTQ